VTSAVSARRPTGRAAALVVAAVLLAATAVAGWSATAGAADGDPLQLRSVDTTDPADAVLRFLYDGDASVDGAVLTDNGASVPSGTPSPTAATEPTVVALVFDTSDAMDSSGALVAAKEAAKDWIESRPASVQARQLVSVFTASAQATRIQSPTSDTERILAAIDRVAPPADPADLEETALWSAIDQAGATLYEEDDRQANIVVMTANGDTVGGSRSAANGAVADAAAAIFAVELQGAGGTFGSLDAMVRDNGGLIWTTEQGTEIGDLVEQATTALDEAQYSVGFETSTEVGSVANLTLQVGDASARASVVVGSAVEGPSRLAPDVTTSSGGVSFLQGPLGMAMMILVVLLAVGALAYAVIMIFVREDRLSAALRPYDDALAAPVEEDDDPHGSALAQTAFVQRAVALTEQVARDRGFLSRAEAALERANLPLRAGEALFFYAAIVVVLTLGSLFLTRSVVLGLVVGFIAAITPVAVVSFLAGQRRRKFMSQLPDMLTLLAGTLRAGYSLMQGVEAVSQEVEEPMGLELRRVVTESRLGRPLEEALDGVAERMASPDFAWAVMAIRIQREVGGNLAELLLTVAETMVARERLRRDVNSLTAEGRISAYILIALPIGLGAVMFALNPDYTDKLISTTIGNVMLALGVVSAIIGYVWMRKIINIRI
jgi:tight adherence protein B